MAREKRELKAQVKQQKAEEQRKAAEEKQRKRAARDRRSLAVKRNIKRYGLGKAKMIAAIITKKKRGEYFFTPKDAERARVWG